MTHARAGRPTTTARGVSSSTAREAREDLLVVDDEDLDELCRDLPACRRATDFETAEQFLRDTETPPEVVVLDMRIPRKSPDDPSIRERPNFGAVKALMQIIEERPGDNVPSVILVTKHDDFTESERQTVRDWYSKGLIVGLVPKTSQWDTCRLILGLQVFSALEHRVLVRGASNDWNIVAADPVMKNVIREISRVADSSCTVLITGESGTGKEVVARAIHSASKRAEGPFVALNCGAAGPKDLLEGELFGSEQGAFTGAISRIGTVEYAEGGTLFLDEVGDMPLEVQVKLLRVLENRKVSRLGSNKEIPVNVRLLAATNADLEAMVSDGRFRSEFYHRINVYTIHLPPLRAHRRDIPPLAHHFLEEFKLRDDKTTIAGFSSDAMRLLEMHDWANNNVRELRNAVERAVVRCDGALITSAHLPDLPVRPFNPNHEQTLLEELRDSVRGDDGIEARRWLKFGPAQIELVNTCLDSLLKPNKAEIPAAGAVGLLRDAIMGSRNEADRKIPFGRKNTDPKPVYLLKILTALVLRHGHEVKQAWFDRFLGVSNAQQTKACQEFRKLFRIIHEDVKRPSDVTIRITPADDEPADIEAPLGQYELTRGQSKLLLTCSKKGVGSNSPRIYRMDLF